MSFLICVAYLWRSKTFKLALNSFIPDFKVLGNICRLGLSSLFTQLCIVATTIVNNVLGRVPDEAYIAMGAQPIVGYNYGAKKYDRVKRLLVLVLLWTGGLCLLFTLFFETVPQLFIAMFGGTAGEGEFTALYREFAIPCLRIYLMFITFGCLQKACAIFLQSMGLAKLAAPLSFLRDLLLIVFAFLLPLGLGVMGVAWAAPLADVAALLVTAPVMIWLWRRLCANSLSTDTAEEGESEVA